MNSKVCDSFVWFINFWNFITSSWGCPSCHYDWCLMSSFEFIPVFVSSVTFGPACVWDPWSLGWVGSAIQDAHWKLWMHGSSKWWLHWCSWCVHTRCQGCSRQQPASDCKSWVVSSLQNNGFDWCWSCSYSTLRFRRTIWLFGQHEWERLTPALPLWLLLNDVSIEREWHICWGECLHVLY